MCACLCISVRVSVSLQAHWPVQAFIGSNFFRAVEQR